jgi:hypothetical protein
MFVVSFFYFSFFDDKLTEKNKIKEIYNKHLILITRMIEFKRLPYQDMVKGCHTRTWLKAAIPGHS